MKHVALKTLLLLPLGWMMLTAPGLAEEKPVVAPPELDPVSGMKMAENWELVRIHCTVCHSPQQYLRQKGNASTWTETIRWMQKSGGLWPLTQETETKIVTYLAQNYGPDEAFRRAPLSGYLMPVNPYGSEAKREFEDKKKSGALPPTPPPQ
ncbi:MAG: hypothetical protein WBE58_22105 [Verrucomicrobiales bacterium]|nr:hypothetical protein [Verrucomicrobiales bacterium]